MCVCVAMSLATTTFMVLALTLLGAHIVVSFQVHILLFAVAKRNCQLSQQCDIFKLLLVLAAYICIYVYVCVFACDSPFLSSNQIFFN